jgi:hypothetical protein
LITGGLAPVTVTVTEPAMALKVAVGSAGPTELDAVKRPEEFTVPQPTFVPSGQVQVARVVRSRVVLPLEVDHRPTASICKVAEVEMVSDGVTVMDSSVAGVMQTVCCVVRLLASVALTTSQP